MSALSRVVLPLTLAAACASGCGGGAASQSGGASGAHPGVETAPELTFRPDTRASYGFRREMVRTRRGERNVTTLEGELRASEADGGWQLALSVARARHTQSDYPIQDFPAETGAPPISIVARVDARGARLGESVSDDLRLALGSEIVQALVLAPIGTSGLALPPRDGLTSAMLGLPPDSVIPSEVAVRCVAQTVDGVSAWTRLRCEAPLDRELEASPEARAQGIRSFLRGSVVIEASVERASGLARRSEVHLAFDVISTLGAYEEHDAVELVLRTEVDPRVR